jgi:hypothetical protein
MMKIIIFIINKAQIPLAFGLRGVYELSTNSFLQVFSLQRPSNNIN